MDNLHSLRFFWPESVLTVAVLAMLVQDLIVRRSKWRVPSLVVGALFWLALTGVATAVTPRGDVPLFGGLLQHDPLRMFFAWLFLGAAVLTVIIVFGFYPQAIFTLIEGSLKNLLAPLQ